MPRKDEISKSRISKNDVENFIEALRKELGVILPNFTSIDDRIREVAKKCFDVRKIDINRIKGF